MSKLKRTVIAVALTAMVGLSNGVVASARDCFCKSCVSNCKCDLDDAIMSKGCSFKANSVQCSGVIDMYGTTPNAFLSVCTYLTNYDTISEEDAFVNKGNTLSFYTSAKCEYVDSSGAQKTTTKGGNGYHEVCFFAPGATQMCSSVVATHKVTVNGVTGSGASTYK